MGRNNPNVTYPNSLQPYLEALSQIPPSDQQMVLTLIRGLAERNGVTVVHTVAPGLQTLEEGIPLWIASLRAEQYSPRTIDEYHLIVSNYLKYDPQPMFLSIQRYLGKRLSEVSSSRVNTDRKALRSFFRFLHSTGLWPTDPTQNLKPIKVSYSERDIPTEGDITNLLKGACYHKRDTGKFRLMVMLLLVDTGLRVHEACSIQKANINFDSREIKVMGKARKERFVPISEFTAGLLKVWQW